MTDQNIGESSGRDTPLFRSRVIGAARLGVATAVPALPPMLDLKTALQEAYNIRPVGTSSPVSITRRLGLDSDTLVIGERPGERASGGQPQVFLHSYMLYMICEEWRIVELVVIC